MQLADPMTIKRKVFDILTATLTDFECTWGFTKRDVPRKWAYLGNTSWPESEWVTNRSRSNQLSIPIVINALMARTPADEVEEYIMSQVTALEGAFGPDSDIRSVNVQTWGLMPRSCGTQPSSDGGLEGQAVVELQVEYRP